MATPVHELESEVLNLPAAERAHLLECLINSFERDEQLEQVWLAEALNREQAVLRGEVAMQSGAEALARIRAQLG